MKNFLYLFLLTGSVLITACDNDNDCDPGLLEDVIVGQWQVSSNGTNEGNVEFLSDGTYLDPDEILVFNPNQDHMEYVVDSETQIRITVQLITPADYIIQIQDFSCDEINLSSVGLDYKLTRN